MQSAMQVKFLGPIAVLLLFFAGTNGWGIDIPGKKVKEFDLNGEKSWVDSGMDVKPGDQLKFTVSGTMHFRAGKEFGPEGTPRGWWDLLRILPVSDANRGAFIGRIGNDEAARPFLVGASRESRAATGGRLFLGLNQSDSDPAEGSFHAVVEILPAAATGPAPDFSKLPSLTQDLLGQIPTRVQDAAGTSGDRVNFLIIGTESEVKDALRAAGWVQVNKSVKDALIEGALATFSRQAYTQLPMSELYLFGRAQDFGYAQADPLRVVASRHHFRLWKAPLTVGGQTLWAGAGTHDIGFDRDQRNGKLTHKIDPDTDKEREYIAASLKDTGKVARITYMTPSQPVTEAKTAHGESFKSDGRITVINLVPDYNDRSESFGSLFCSVLNARNPDGGEWGDCSQYLESPGKRTEELGPISTKYRLLIVPGLMNTCFAGAPAYKEGQEYLKTKYSMTVELLSVPNNSSEENAHTIAAYLQDKMQEDKRKYIVLGYSKGTPDLQVALAREPAAVAAVAAFISVAGASGGSPVADAIPSQADRWIRQYNLPNCQGDLSQGFKSLSQASRRAFLSSYPNPMVPTYSLAAYSNQANTSTMLLQTWKLLSAFSPQNDSQLTKDGASIPGSIYLGSALADHFAVALPFETSNESMRSGADKNHYPRTALLEAMVRFVIRDLETPK
jgi:hypothetical protein